MSDEEHQFEPKSDAGDLKTYPQQAGTVPKSGPIVIENRSCKEEAAANYEQTILGIRKSSKSYSYKWIDSDIESDGDEDDDHQLQDFFPEDAYNMLKSVKFLFNVVRGRGRIQRLLKSQREHGLDSPLVGMLKDLEGYLTDFLCAKQNLDTDKDALKKSRLIDLAKLILPLWESIENQLPQPKLPMALADHPQAVPSSWLFEHNWRDKAYDEILFLRKKYSYFLDQEYRDRYHTFIMKNGAGRIRVLDVILCKKLLKLVGCSREDIDRIGVVKCFERVMSIKEVCLSTKLLPIDVHAEAQKSADEIELRNWRDGIYEQIKSFRKMYSLKMDELLIDEVNKLKSLATPGAGSMERLGFIKDSLQFLSLCRDGVALIQDEEGCVKLLDDIKQFMEREEGSLSAAKQQEESPSLNWRDFEYDVLQTKKLRFQNDMLFVYRKYQPAWSKMTTHAEELKKLEFHIGRLDRFYTMKRGKMALLYHSLKDYHTKCWDDLKKEVKETIELMKLLLGCLEAEGAKPTRVCAAMPLIPKGLKLASMWAR